MNTEYFDKIEQYFNKNFESIEDIVKDTLLKSVKKVVTKGIMYSLEPFEYEFQYGKRTSKKILPEVVPEDDCYRVHFDEQDRVIAVGNASKFLSKPNKIYIKTDCIFIYEDDIVWKLSIS